MCVRARASARTCVRVCVCVCQRHRCHRRRRRRRRRRCYRCRSLVDTNCVCRLRASLLRTRVRRVSRISPHIVLRLFADRSSTLVEISENTRRRRGEDVGDDATWIERRIPPTFAGTCRVSRWKRERGYESLGSGYRPRLGDVLRIVASRDVRASARRERERERTGDRTRAARKKRCRSRRGMTASK